MLWCYPYGQLHKTGLCYSDNDIVLSYPILSYPILSYPILSYPILSYPILSYPILYYPILSYPILSYPILSFPIVSYPILSYPILSFPILSYTILSYPILSYTILSYPILSNDLLCCITFPERYHNTEVHVLLCNLTLLSLLRCVGFLHLIPCVALLYSIHCDAHLHSIHCDALLHLIHSILLVLTVRRPTALCATVLYMQVIMRPELIGSSVFKPTLSPLESLRKYPGTSSTINNNTDSNSKQIELIQIISNCILSYLII